MSELTASAVNRYSAGDQTKLVITFASVTDGDTYASGLGSNVQDWYYVGTANQSTQTSAGGNVANSSGTFTIYPGENALTGTLVVYASI